MNKLNPALVCCLGKDKEMSVKLWAQHPPFVQCGCLCQPPSDVVTIHLMKQIHTLHCQLVEVTLHDKRMLC